MLQPTGKAKIAYERGVSAGAFGKSLSDNPYKHFGFANDMLAAWWSTGYEKGLKNRKLSTEARK